MPKSMRSGPDEGYSSRRTRGEKGIEDDTVGQSMRMKAVEDDTEGHRRSVKAVEDDTEGHGGLKHPKAVEDDTEGHQRLKK